jgi:hypothetical protein
MGAHPRLRPPSTAPAHPAPSTPSATPVTSALTYPSVTLDAVIAGDPEQELGAECAARFGGRLPFLLKVLSAEKALSIQVHPSRAQAEAGYAAENARGLAADDPARNYVDDWPKPELLYALTPFEVAAGLRTPADASALLQALDVDELEPLAAALADAVGEDALGSALASVPERPEPRPLVARWWASAPARIVPSRLPAPRPSGSPPTTRATLACRPAAMRHEVLQPARRCSAPLGWSARLHARHPVELPPTRQRGPLGLTGAPPTSPNSSNRRSPQRCPSPGALRSARGITCSTPRSRSSASRSSHRARARPCPASARILPAWKRAQLAPEGGSQPSSTAETPHPLRRRPRPRHRYPGPDLAAPPPGGPTHSWFQGWLGRANDRLSAVSQCRRGEGVEA